MGKALGGGRPPRWWSYATIVILGTLAVVSTAAAQGTPPLQATIRFQTPPVDGVFPAGSPINIVLQVKSNGGALFTTQGFSNSEFWRDLFFIDPQGNRIVNVAAGHSHSYTQVFHCHSRLGILQRPTALTVFPVEQVASDFAREFILDARRFYDLRRPGRWRVNAQIHFLQFMDVDPNTVLRDCDQPGGDVVNVGDPSLQGGVLQRQHFVIASNFLEFLNTRFRFPGFGTPLVNDQSPGCTVLPCKSYKFGSTIPVKFQLFDGNGALVTNATPHIEVEFVSSGTPPTVPEDLGTGAADTGNQFRFDGSSGQYIFNLNTTVLKPGTWRIDAILDDGVVRSVHIGLR